MELNEHTKSKKTAMKTANKISFLAAIEHRIDGWIAGISSWFSPFARVVIVLIVWGLVFLFSVGYILWWVCGLGVRG